MAAGPTDGHGHFALVPRRGDPARIHVFPVWMRVKRLRILLQVVGDSRPASGHLEETPASGGDLLRTITDWLPAPQAIETNPFPSRRALVIRLCVVPYG